MLDRLLTALDHPRVDGVLGSAEILDDLALLDALHDKVAVGTMNRGGLAGASGARRPVHGLRHGAPSRLPTSTPASCCCASTTTTPAPCRRWPRRPHAVQELNDAHMMAMVEPIPYTKNAQGEAVWDTDPLALVKAVGVSAALGGSSAYTWLKIQATADIATVAQGDDAAIAAARRCAGPDPEATFALWEAALHEPTVRGLVIGQVAAVSRVDGDVAAAVSRAADLVQQAAKDRQ